MNSEVKEKWLAELRSGQYKQGATALKSNYQGNGLKYCCLGVLCEMAVAEGVVDKVNTNSRGETFFDEEFNGLPPSVQEWAGLDRLGAITLGNRQTTLAELNDGGTPFRFIADIIEEKL